MENDAYKNLQEKIAELRKGKAFDLSMDEDLSIAIMNLVSLEEHFFFTAEKTGKDEYLDLLSETREIRKELLGKMVSAHEGETWCISKHLLAASMRIMEVGTKQLGTGSTEEAKRMFDLSYKVYSLFWALRLKLIDLSGVKKIDEGALTTHDGEGADPKKPWTVEDIVTKLVNCCDE